MTSCTSTKRPPAACTRGAFSKVHDPGVLRFDLRHLEDIAVDQLDAIIRLEDAGLGHPVVVGDRESAERESIRRMGRWRSHDKLRAVLAASAPE